jgi:hypothetical protein
MSDVSEKGSDFIRNLGDAARQNPLSAALIGMGRFVAFHWWPNRGKGRGVCPQPI